MEQKTFLTAPVAILIAGAVIAVAIVYSVGKFSGPSSPINEEPIENTADLEKLRPISAQDHILGNADAPVKIIEFSDTECPFCKRFHTTMQDVVKQYDGKVAWAYRHFPLTQLHTKAFNEAKATECAAKLGGQPGSEASHAAFWKYIDRLFEITPSNDGLDPAELPRIADAVGLDRDAFAKCLASNEMDKRINDDLENAIATGGNGTPWSILIAPDGKKYPINGAQPIEAIKQIIDLALKK